MILDARSAEEETIMRTATRTICRCLAAISCATAILLSASAADAQEDAARKILKAMSDYLGGQKVVSMRFDADVEVMTVELQKIQFASSGNILLSRPNRLRGTRTGGYHDVEFVFDGKTFTIHDRANESYAQTAAEGSVDELVSKLRDGFNIEAPGADLLMSNTYNVLIETAFDGKHIGLGVIDGVECEHLAFRTPDVDWQIWIEAGARPIPRKYVITNKTVTGMPQYTLRIKELSSDAQVAADSFSFKPPAGVKQIEFSELASLDEIPEGVIMGEVQ
jgi:hypothetical protein